MISFGSTYWARSLGIEYWRWLAGWGVGEVDEEVEGEQEDDEEEEEEEDEDEDEVVVIICCSSWPKGKLE